MKSRFRIEGDNWTPDGSKITEPAKLEAIQLTLDKEGPIIVEHWFYHGAPGSRTPGVRGLPIKNDPSRISSH
jgi:hypothetical protein